MMIHKGDILLDYVWEFGVKVSHLASDDVEGLFNRPHHGLDKASLLRELMHLYKIGYVQFKDSSEIVAQCNTIIDLDSRDLFVFLAESGGLRWEHLVNPQWDKYFSVSSAPKEHFAWEFRIESGSKEMIKAALDKVKDQIVVHGRGLTLISPWHPTYWKTRTKGYVIEFETSEDSFDIVGSAMAIISNSVKWKGSLY